MATGNISSATTTNMSNTITDYSVDSKKLDYSGDEEFVVSFPEAQENMGYYFNIPELKSAVDALARWVVGKGWNVENPKNKSILENLTGWGEDTIDNIFWNMLVVKKVVGDSFAEIIRSGKTIVNLKPVSPERIRIVTNKQGRIKRYEIYDGKNWKQKKTQDILHLSNDRFGDQVHGTSIVNSCKWVIKARNEALETNKIIDRRGRALGIAYYKTNNTGKITYANSQIEEAVKNGEMLGLPDDTVDIKEFPTKSTSDNLSWIQYLENFFYQALGIPKIILGGSEQVSEGSNKMTTLTFEQVYISEQRQLEQDIWNQLAIKITFTKPASIADNIQMNEAKNTSQTNLQPKDTMVTGGNE